MTFLDLVSSQCEWFHHIHLYHCFLLFQVKQSVFANQVLLQGFFLLHILCFFCHLFGLMKCLWSPDMTKFSGTTILDVKEVMDHEIEVTYISRHQYLLVMKTQ